MFRTPGSIATYLIIIAISANAAADDARRPLVLASDFGTTERFVASMTGVALNVDRNLQVHDLTHHIEPYDIWQASYLLAGTIDYWPEGTVFVSVVDPGVGTERRSVVARTVSGHYVVTPDNGTLTLVADSQGIAEVREIDETSNRRPGSEDSHTFHGRDVYVYTGARLAAGVIRFDEVGPLLESGIKALPYQKPKRLGDDSIAGNITHVEKPFGNIVTNIPKALVDALDVSPREGVTVDVEVRHAGSRVFQAELPYVRSFDYVDRGAPLLYSDSLQMIGLAINSGNFAEQYGVSAGESWTIRLVVRPAR